MKQIVLFLKKWISIIIDLSANLQRHFKVGTFLDVLWGQPIKLVQMAFISELHENQQPWLLQNHSFSFLQGLISLKN